jgi:SAM-dependent methyltransferase
MLAARIGIARRPGAATASGRPRQPSAGEGVDCSAGGLSSRSGTAPIFRCRVGGTCSTHVRSRAASLQGVSGLKMSDTSIVDLYERHAHGFDRDRNRSLQEKVWLDRFLGHVQPGKTVLDVGCGMGEPIARYCLEAGFRVVGIDSSLSMIAMCRARFPHAEWYVADMRDLALGRRFEGILAWDSFFHLTAHAQRGMFPRFASHAQPGAPLLFTSGTSEGEAIGSYCGEPLYHASLNVAEYEHLLASSGFTVERFVPNDPECWDHSVWLAVHGESVPV